MTQGHEYPYSRAVILFHEDSVIRDWIDDIPVGKRGAEMRRMLVQGFWQIKTHELANQPEALAEARRRLIAEFGPGIVRELSPVK